MKIETIEQAIAAIESAKIRIVAGDTDPTSEGYGWFLGIYPGYDKLHLKTEDELIEFARRWQLKAFW